MELFNTPRTASSAAASSGNLVKQRHSPWENRPAWAQPTTSWPFRVIDPQSHRIGVEVAHAQPGWAS